MVRYGNIFPDEAGDCDIENWCFLNRHPAEKGGLGTFRHFRQSSKYLWPKMEWSDWAKDRIETLCDYDSNAWTGCASSGKTHDAGYFAMIWWAMAPQYSTVVLTSTTGKMVRKRIWPIIQELYHSAEKVKGSQIFGKGFPGNLVDSKTTLQAVKGDDKHGIFAIAVRDGPTSKAVADIQGVHSERMMLVIDEATDTPEAIFEAITNLRKGCQEFKLLVIGNPISHLDPHGLCCEPAKGWNGITIEDTEWETAGVPKWEIEPGMCLHFDGLKSPNIKAGHKKYSYLISAEDVDRARRTENGEESIGFWKFTRGFWPPEGLCHTIFSESMVDKYGGKDKHKFHQTRINIAGLDTAFGGDRCILKFAHLGDLDPTGKKGLTITETIEINVKAKSNNPVDYQIARQVMDECKVRGVTPGNFALDSTGTGRGVAAILAEEFGTELYRVEFGGSPSNKPASADDPRPSHEVYDRRVTELWYSCREFLMGGQLKGLTNEDTQEFCAREYTIKGRKYAIDTKEECRKKIGKSPDLADAIVVLCELARHLGATAGTSRGVMEGRTILDVARKYDDVYATEEADDFSNALQLTYD